MRVMALTLVVVAGWVEQSHAHALAAHRALPLLQPHCSRSVCVGSPASPAAAPAASALVVRVRRAREVVRMFSEPPPEMEDDWAEELSEDLTTLQKLLVRVSPSVVRTGAKLSAGVGALAAFMLMPTFNRILGLLAMGAGGVAGQRFGKRLVEIQKTVVPLKIAELVKMSQEEGTKIKGREMRQIKQRYKLDDEQLQAAVEEVYGAFLNDLVAEAEEIEVSEISQLGKLRKGLQLRWNETEAIHKRKAAEMLEEQRPRGALTPPELSKLLWLTAGLFSTSTGKADFDELTSEVSLEASAAQSAIDGLSAPIYEKGVLKTVAKYNSTDAPEVLETIRRALSLSEETAQGIHTGIYDSQLELVVGGEEKMSISEESMALLGELEGILQIRGAGARIMERTLPVYASAAAEALRQAGTGASVPTVWGDLAVRQQELALPSETAKASFVDEARSMASQMLSSSAQLQADGKQAPALEKLSELLEHAEFVGSLLQTSGWEDGARPASDIAEQYLGAIDLDEGLAKAARDLLKASLSEGADGAREDLLRSMLALSSPKIEADKRAFSDKVDAVLAAANFGEATTRQLDELAIELKLPRVVSEKLCLDGYYGWLSDLSERAMASDKAQLDRCSAARRCFRLDPTAVNELYANTEIDEAVLERCRQIAMEEREASGELNPEDLNWLSRIERELQARPGGLSDVLARVVIEE